MFRLLQVATLAVAFGLVMTTPTVHAAKKKSASSSKKSTRKPASKGFKVKISGDFTRVIDEEQGIVCYFAKQGGGSCVNLPN